MGMTEAEFHQKAGEVLLRLEEAIERAVESGADMDYETAAEILTLEFADGSKIIVNKQTPARQIWVAARAGGFHFDYEQESGRWVNRQNGEELFAALSDLASRQSGETISL